MLKGVIGPNTLPFPLCCFAISNFSDMYVYIIKREERITYV
jgi:hypothetical protein